MHLSLLLGLAMRLLSDFLALAMTEIEANYHGQRVSANYPYSKRTVPYAMRLKVFERDGFMCKKCGSKKQLTIDHVISERRGGPTMESNLQTLCNDCNMKKGSQK